MAGKYYCYISEGTILGKSEQVAILFDTETTDWTLLHHGPPDSVKFQARKLHKAYEEQGMTSITKDFFLIEGKFPVDELNKLINTEGYGEEFCNKLSKVKAQE